MKLSEKLEIEKKKIRIAVALTNEFIEEIVHLEVLAKDREDLVKERGELLQELEDIKNGIEKIVEEQVMKELQATGMVEKAANWKLLEKLPTHTKLVHQAHDNKGPFWSCCNYLKDEAWAADTPAEALQAYWKSKEKENDR